jgi:hypothetical protein
MHEGMDGIGWGLSSLNLIDLLGWAKGELDLNEGHHMHETGEEKRKMR